MTRIRLLPLSLLLAATACEVTLPWTTQTDPPAPEGFTLSDPSFTGARLSWSSQAGIDGWELEMRVGTGPWTAPLLVVDAISGTWTFDSPPELTTVAFRLRAVAGSHRSEWREVSMRLGVLPPTNVSATPIPTSLIYENYGPITLRWTNVSAFATDLRILRRPSSNDPALPWTELSAPSLSAGVLVDRDAPEGVWLTYLLMVGTGGVWSEPEAVQSLPIMMQEPWGLTAEYVTSGVQLRWNGTSTKTVETAVYKSNGEYVYIPTVILSASAREWLDPSPLVWPSTQYEVEWHDAPAASAPHRTRTDWVHLAPFRLSGPPVLDASAPDLPYADWPARDAGGRFHGIAFDPYAPYVGPATVYRGTANGFDPHTLTTVRLVYAPGVVLDADGNPHVLYERAADSNAPVQDLVHAWWNGSDWDAEELGTLPRTEAGSWALGAAGAVHLVHASYMGQGPTVHRVYEAGVMTMTSLDPAPIPGFTQRGWAFALGPDGTTVIVRHGFLFPDGSDAVGVDTRAPDGSWSFDPVPISSYVYYASVVAGSGGDLVFAYDAGPVRTIRRAGGIWSTPEDVFTRYGNGGLALAGAPDLSRLALSAISDGRARLHVRGDAGWQGGEIGPSAPPGWVGFGPSGAWALYRVSTYGSSACPCGYSLFAEPPP
jgi:hypothetical protein